MEWWSGLIALFSRCFELMLIPKMIGSIISPWCCMLTEQRSMHLLDFHHLYLCLEDNHNSQTCFPTQDLIQTHIRPTFKKNLHHYVISWNLRQHKQHSGRKTSYDLRSTTLNVSDPVWLSLQNVEKLDPRWERK